ncbi:hypothetical protein NC653_013442 [Populus alba x Populus x berolinensis]|uniref:K+ potassium transporter integral membrane domain-containing protein n=1 Tax=Populus alba x Populus x berolinensis TaxID=444605 RepID=A0AAD6W308_9ROSI|nr:hypothetical protein NC653_013442 [Populus alba x Populus x berolinensis]
MIIVLGANDNGEGGTFALYSLLCRHSRMGLLNSSHLEHEFVTCYDSNVSTKETRASLVIKEFFNKHRSSRVVLLLVVLLGTSMVIGDGIPTPAMSVLSAVYGIQIKDPDLHENYTVAIACVILVGVFALQHCGTHRIGFLFSPILIAWLLCISGVGIYNISHWNPDVVKALSPYYIYNFFKKTGKAGWCSLGGIVLCATGAEAMFADLGHFSELSVRIAFTGLVYPCLVLAYMGEAAYLSRNRGDLQSSFYKAVPVFIIATLATVVGSQAIISAIFSIISQCRALNCFPRVKIVHTSNNIHGQIYIPEVNWVLMILCLAVVAGFTEAYGLAVITVMYGYKDIRDSYAFETQLIEKISEFLKRYLSSKQMVVIEQSLHGAKTRRSGELRFQCQEASEDVNELMEAEEAGVVYMIGHTCVISNEASCILKKFVINVVYGFLRRHSRSPAASVQAGLKIRAGRRRSRWLREAPLGGRRSGLTREEALKENLVDKAYEKKDEIKRKNEGN